MSTATPEQLADWCPPDDGSGNADAQPDRKQLVNHKIRNSLCQLGMRPLILTGSLRHILIHLFSSPSQIEEPDLREYTWQQGQQTSILIEDVNRWRGDLVEFRPAILLKRNSIRNMRYGIADRVGHTIDGHDAYNTFWIGSHTIFCINGSAASTELLATEVQRGLVQFGPAIAQQLMLAKFQVTEVGAVSEMEESTENFVIPISVGWAYQETWELTRESLKLSSLIPNFVAAVGT